MTFTDIPPSQQDFLHFLFPRTTVQHSRSLLAFVLTQHSFTHAMHDAYHVRISQTYRTVVMIEINRAIGSPEQSESIYQPTIHRLPVHFRHCMLEHYLPTGLTFYLITSLVAPSLIAPSLIAPSLIAPSLIAPSLIAPSLIAPSLIAPSLIAASILSESPPSYLVLLLRLHIPSSLE